MMACRAPDIRRRLFALVLSGRMDLAGFKVMTEMMRSSYLVFLQV